MALDPGNLDDAVMAFLRERHLAMLTTVRADATPHVVAVGFSYDVAERVARIITWTGSVKAANAARMEATGQHAAVGQVDGGRWLSLEGPVRLVTDPALVVAGVDGYAARYGPPKSRDDRAVVEIDVTRILGRA